MVKSSSFVITGIQLSYLYRTPPPQVALHAPYAPQEEKVQATAGQTFVAHDPLSTVCPALAAVQVTFVEVQATAGQTFVPPHCPFATT